MYDLHHMVGYCCAGSSYNLDKLAIYFQFQSLDVPWPGAQSLLGFCNTPETPFKQWVIFCITAQYSRALSPLCLLDTSSTAAPGWVYSPSNKAAGTIAYLLQSLLLLWAPLKTGKFLSHSKNSLQQYQPCSIY